MDFGRELPDAAGRARCGRFFIPGKPAVGPREIHSAGAVVQSRDLRLPRESWAVQHRVGANGRGPAAELAFEFEAVDARGRAAADFEDVHFGVSGNNAARPARVPAVVSGLARGARLAARYSL